MHVCRLVWVFVFEGGGVGHAVPRRGIEFGPGAMMHLWIAQ
jgi:hypothetical protein